MVDGKGLGSSMIPISGVPWTVEWSCKSIEAPGINEELAHPKPSSLSLVSVPLDDLRVTAVGSKAKLN
jgi:hypothetical protein